MERRRSAGFVRLARVRGACRAAAYGATRRIIRRAGGAGMAGALALAVAAGCASVGPERRAEEHIRDAAITASVKNALFVQPGTEGFDVQVDTRDGVVQLKGTVASAAERARAEAVARSIEGVRAVHNALMVKSR